MNEEKKLDEKDLEGVSGGTLGVYFYTSYYRCPKCKVVKRFDMDPPSWPVCPVCHVDMELADDLIREP